MDWSLISQFIQTVGFPAVCVIGMGWYVKYITDQHHEETKQMTEDHKTGMAGVTKCIQDNTLAIQKLTDYIMMGKDDLK